MVRRPGFASGLRAAVGRAPWGAPLPLGQAGRPGAVVPIWVRRAPVRRRPLAVMASVPAVSARTRLSWVFVQV